MPKYLTVERDGRTWAVRTEDGVRLTSLNYVTLKRIREFARDNGWQVVILEEGIRRDVVDWHVAKFESKLAAEPELDSDAVAAWVARIGVNVTERERAEILEQALRMVITNRRY